MPWLCQLIPRYIFYQSIITSNEIWSECYTAHTNRPITIIFHGLIYPWSIRFYNNTIHMYTRQIILLYNKNIQSFPRNNSKRVNFNLMPTLIYVVTGRNITKTQLFYEWHLTNVVISKLAACQEGGINRTVECNARDKSKHSDQRRTCVLLTPRIKHFLHTFVTE